ncbi:LacI family DNA-binding transcriptional regulator [Ruania alkalisoli]|uniref:LacI family DNA-binding transcriptional regulator n=1 Tax=Ruania alkalisoli TaxID=2779775 RepID=A0A7M1SUF5_9MICO|nr:LacI family DNA-binding transcriptional regulator [Ruania alkalisoli]QOR71165.1 LacI family DNA-binding transcriptional regulator [Ruania alkalisoli]
MDGHALPPGIRLVDIARRAGVSIKTVSRVVNGEPHVADTTRELIQRTIVEMGQNNPAPARSASTRRSGTVGLIFPDVRNDYFAACSRALQARLSTFAPVLLSGDSDDDVHTEERLLQAMRRQELDGLVIFPTGAPSLPDFARTTPTVVVDRTVPAIRGKVDHVLPDSRRAAEALTLHMIDQHQLDRVCLIAGNLNISTLHNRHLAFQRVVARTGTTNHVAAGMTSIDDAESAAYALFREVEPPFGVLATNALMFWGTVSAVARLGLRIPTDVVLTTFDAIPGIGNTGLIPTNAVAPATTLAARTVQLLTERTHNPRLPPRMVEIDYDITYGTSCGCIPIDPERNVLG